MQNVQHQLQTVYDDQGNNYSRVSQARDNIKGRHFKSVQNWT